MLLQSKYGLATANWYTDTLLRACKICTGMHNSRSDLGRGRVSEELWQYAGGLAYNEPDYLNVEKAKANQLVPCSNDVVMFAYRLLVRTSLRPLKIHDWTRYFNVVYGCNRLIVFSINSRGTNLKNVKMMT